MNNYKKTIYVIEFYSKIIKDQKNALGLSRFNIEKNILFFTNNR